MLGLLLLPYILFVIAGWIRIKPGQFVISDYFFHLNRYVNKKYLKSTTGNTISSDFGIVGGWKMWLINLIALDPWHCQGYKGI